jgi:hypothetical protein
MCFLPLFAVEANPIAERERSMKAATPSSPDVVSSFWGAILPPLDVRLDGRSLPQFALNVAWSRSAVKRSCRKILLRARTAAASRPKSDG